MATVANVITLGLATATFNGTDCGTLKDCKGKISKVVHEAKVKEISEAPLAAFHGGELLELEAVILERDYDILAAILADCGAKVVGTATTGTKFTVGKLAGSAVTSGELQVTSAIETTEQFTMHKAYVASSTPTITWDTEGVAHDAFNVVFRSMIDTSKSDGDYLGSIGVDDAAVS